MCVCVWGGTLILSYIYVAWDHFGGFKILNFNIFFYFYLFFFFFGGGGQKYHYFWGYKDFVDISL